MVLALRAILPARDHCSWAVEGGRLRDPGDGGLVVRERGVVRARYWASLIAWGDER